MFRAKWRSRLYSAWRESSSRTGAVHRDHPAGRLSVVMVYSASAPMALERYGRASVS
jgi:hypothetical protein